MDKSNLELFKQAVSEGLSKRFDNVADSYTEEIECSENHKLAMQAIIYGKTDAKLVWSPNMKRIIAIIVAAALLITGCGIIFRNEICEVFKDLFASMTFEGSEPSVDTIEDIYELGYLPEGYFLDKQDISCTVTKSKFINLNGDYFYFEQGLLIESNFTFDSESGYSKIDETENYTVYYRYTKAMHSYIWNNDKYAFVLKSSTELSNEELIKIINGITKK